MTLPIILLVVGIIFLYGGITNNSISELFVGRITPRNPSSPAVDNSLPASTAGGTTVPIQTSAVGSLFGLVSPISPNATFARIDQGVDWAQSVPYTALGTGTVQQIASGWAGGTGQAVYVKLNNPIKIGSRTYDGYYVAETKPLVRVGQRVKTGQQIASGGSAELGFLINGFPTPLVGGLGQSTKPTQAGQDFYDLVNQLLGRK